MHGIRIGRIERAAEARMARERAIESRDLARVDRAAEVFEHRERGPASLQLRDVGSADARAVAGEVDTGHRRASLDRALREPLARIAREREAASGQISEL